MNSLHDLFADLNFRPGSLFVELAGAESTVNLFLAEKQPDCFLLGYELDPLGSPFTDELGLRTFKEYREYMGAIYRKYTRHYLVRAGFLEGNISSFYSDFRLILQQRGYRTYEEFLQHHDVVITLDTCSLGSVSAFRSKTQTLFPNGLPKGIYIVLSSDNHRHPLAISRVAQECFGTDKAIRRMLELARRKGPQRVPRMWALLNHPNTEGAYDATRPRV